MKLHLFFLKIALAAAPLAIGAQPNLIPLTVHFEQKHGNAIFGPAEMAAIAANFTDSVAAISGNDLTLMLPAGGNYSIAPLLDIDVKNGVTTFDVVTTRKHILEIEPFSSPYQFVAADINHDNVVSTTDLVAASKVILGVDSLLPFNTSWRFVDSAFVFDSLKNPLEQAFNEAILVENLQEPMNIGFVAVKIGDVDFPTTATRTAMDAMSGLAIDPNPAGAWANFRFEMRHREAVRLDIFEPGGKLVLTEKKDGLLSGRVNWRVEISNLKAGEYFAKLTSVHGAASGKLIKGQ